MAEGMIRVGIDWSLDYTSILSPGQYCIHPKLGLTTACPGRKGVMRAFGSRNFAAYEVGKFGFRGPFTGGPMGEQPRKEILLLGGQSQGWGLGLNNDQTYAAVAARSSCGPLRVNNIALLGTSTPLTWATFLETSAAHTQPDHVFLIVYWDFDPQWEAYMANYINSTPFAVLGGWYFELPAWMPALFHQSAVVVRSSKHIRDALTRLISSTGEVRETAVPPTWGRSEELATPPTAGQAFVRFLEQWAHGKGAEFSIVVLPNAQINKDAFKGLDDIPLLDLDQKARDANMNGELLPGAHYNARLAEFIGKQIAHQICLEDVPHPFRSIHQASVD